MAVKLSSPKECRSAYREILQGYSFSSERGFYVKHFREADMGFLDDLYRICIKDLKEMDIPSIKEKLAFLKEEDYWTEKEENSYLTASLAVKDAYEFYEKMVDSDQKKNFKKTMIPEAEQTLKKTQAERMELLEPTRETICEKRLNELYVYHAIYKDKDLAQPYYSKEEFSDLSHFELGDVVKTYNYETSRFSEQNLKIIGVNYFFLNSFFMSNDDPVKFYGKNVLELTMYQMSLFSRGKFYKSVLTEGKDPPDQYFEESYENGLQELVNWYDIEHNKIVHDRERKANVARAGRR